MTKKGYVDSTHHSITHVFPAPLQMALKFLGGAAKEGFAAANALIGKVLAPQLHVLLIVKCPLFPPLLLYCGQYYYIAPSFPSPCTSSPSPSLSQPSM